MNETTETDANAIAHYLFDERDGQKALQYFDDALTKFELHSFAYFVAMREILERIRIQGAYFTKGNLINEWRIFLDGVKNRFAAIREIHFDWENEAVGVIVEQEMIKFANTARAVMQILSRIALNDQLAGFAVIAIMQANFEKKFCPILYTIMADCEYVLSQFKNPTPNMLDNIKILNDDLSSRKGRKYNERN